MATLKSNAAAIIAKRVTNLDGVPTHSPYTMANQWNSLFDSVKTGVKKMDIGDVTSSRWDVRDAFFMDDSSESQMLTSILHNNTVQLNNVDVTRQSRFVVGKYGAYLVKDPHVVDYVLCHLKGYKRHFFGKGFKYVKGRDVILSGTLLSIGEIIDMMKHEIETLIWAERA